MRLDGTPVLAGTALSQTSPLRMAPSISAVGIFDPFGRNSWAWTLPAARTTMNANPSRFAISASRTVPGRSATGFALAGLRLPGLVLRTVRVLDRQLLRRQHAVLVAVEPAEGLHILLPGHFAVAVDIEVLEGEGDGMLRGRLAVRLVLRARAGRGEQQGCEGAADGSQHIDLLIQFRSWPSPSDFRRFFLFARFRGFLGLSNGADSFRTGTSTAASAACSNASSARRRRSAGFPASSAFKAAA